MILDMSYKCWFYSWQGSWVGKGHEIIFHMDYDFFLLSAFVACAKIGDKIPQLKSNPYSYVFKTLQIAVILFPRPLLQGFFLNEFFLKYVHQSMKKRHWNAKLMPLEHGNLIDK